MYLSNYMSLRNKKGKGNYTRKNRGGAVVLKQAYKGKYNQFLSEQEKLELVIDDTSRESVFKSMSHMFEIVREKEGEEGEKQKYSLYITRMVLPDEVEQFNKNTFKNECTEVRFIQFTGTCWVNTVMNMFIMPLESRNIFFKKYNKWKEQNQRIFFNFEPKPPSYFINDLIVEKSAELNNTESNNTEKQDYNEYLNKGKRIKKYFDLKREEHSKKGDMEVNKLKEIIYSDLIKYDKTDIQFFFKEYFFSLIHMIYDEEKKSIKKITSDDDYLIMLGDIFKLIHIFFNGNYGDYFLVSYLNMETGGYTEILLDYIVGIIFIDVLLIENNYKQEIKKEIIKEGTTYKLCSCNITISCKGNNHAVAGIICNDKPYIFDSNNYITEDDWVNYQFDYYISYYNTTKKNININNLIYCKVV